ncbi:MAG: Fic family protein [Deltaproteobacteria bacterium]|nr:Fic family protein [Deltaproteobacteria bacterium]
MLVVRSLRWQDLDASRTFDPLTVRPALEATLLEAALGISDGRRPSKKLWDDRKLNRELSRLLVAEYGAWAAGWSWGNCNGGPVRCGEGRCPRHLAQFLRVNHPSVSGLADIVIGQLDEWRQFIARLAAAYVEIRSHGAGLEAGPLVERAAAKLLPMILEITKVQDAWYESLIASLCWFADDLGVDPDRARPIIRSVVSGRFHSWMGLNSDDAALAFRSLAQRLADEASSPREPDALEAWLAVRARAPKVDSANSPQLVPVVRDGHETYIERCDRRRSVVRADRLSSALTLCRSDARTGRDLDFELLKRWQRAVLDLEHVELRGAPAFAKGGWERYGVLPDLRRQFEAALGEANDAAVPAIERAARVYLDVCFFHPFADGNARAARLALDFVLSREGLALHSGEPIFVCARDASDRFGIWSLGLVIQSMIGLRAAG